MFNLRRSFLLVIAGISVMACNCQGGCPPQLPPDPYGVLTFDVVNSSDEEFRFWVTQYDETHSLDVYSIEKLDVPWPYDPSVKLDPVHPGQSVYQSAVDLTPFAGVEKWTVKTCFAGTNDCKILGSWWPPG